jgi:hypothetical protein
MESLLKKKEKFIIIEKDFIKMKNFLKFLLIWISQNLAIPFWIVGHIHLSIHNYHDVIEILSSLSMNLLVATGFFLDYQENGKK